MGQASSADDVTIYKFKETGLLDLILETANFYHDVLEGNASHNIHELDFGNMVYYETHAEHRFKIPRKPDTRYQQDDIVAIFQTGIYCETAVRFKARPQDGLGEELTGWTFYSTERW